MSYQASTWAYAQPVDSTGRKFVLVALANYADEEGSCYPGQEKLAEMTGQSVRSVQRHLDQLVADGLISRHHRQGVSGFRTSDRYHLGLGDNLAGRNPRRQSDGSNLTPQVIQHDSLSVVQHDTRVIQVVREPSVEPSVRDAATTAPTVNQRVKRMTDSYAEAEPMCKWPAVAGIVRTAIKAGRWDDAAIGSALQRLAVERRPVTVAVLQTELDGLPPVRAPNGTKPSTTDQRVAAGLALADRYRKEESRVQESSERAAIPGRSL